MPTRLASSTREVVPVAKYCRSGDSYRQTPAQTVNAIRNKLDFIKLMKEYLPDLRPAGRSLIGLCPFHKESEMSLFVSLERRTFHCFECGAGGDAFAFVAMVRKVSYWDAVKLLAIRVGVKVAKRRRG